MTMLSGFIKSVESFPINTAMTIGGKAYSYEWLYNKAQAIANAIDRESTNGDNLIGLYTDNNEFTYAALIGILLSGRGFVPLNNKFPNERLQKICTDSSLTTIVACSGSKSRIEEFSNAKVIFIDEQETEPNTKYNYVSSPDQIVYILFTSGSTGIPKGIPITNKNFSALMAALNSRFSLVETDIVLQAFELSFDVSLACTFIAWENGANLLVPDMSGITAVNAFKAIYEYKATFVTLPPSAIFYLKKLKMLGTIKVPSVHTTLFTGEALPFKLVSDWKTSAEISTIENAYGPTETTVWCLFYKLDSSTENQTINGLCPIGGGLSGVNYKIVNDKNETVSAGERGELLVSGDQIFTGYWNNDVKSSQAFSIDTDGVRWYKTGDIVVLNEHGNVIYINRKDNQVQVNGYRVELGEVEHALKKASGIESLVVLAKITDEYTDLFAFIEGDFIQSEIQVKLKDKLPFYMIPRHFISVNPLPVNTNGKIDKQYLQHKYLS